MQDILEYAALSSEIMGNSQFAVVTGNRDERLEGTARWISNLDYYIFPFVSKDYVAIPKKLSHNVAAEFEGAYLSPRCGSIFLLN
jgi:hypothetical protein